MADPVVAGMDGCRAGWFVVLRSRAGERTACAGTFAEALEAARGAASVSSMPRPAAAVRAIEPRGPRSVRATHPCSRHRCGSR